MVEHGGAIRGGAWRRDGSVEEHGGAIMAQWYSMKVQWLSGRAWRCNGSAIEHGGAILAQW